MFFLSNRNLRNWIITFQKTSFSEICRNKVTAYTFEYKKLKNSEISPRAIF